MFKWIIMLTLFGQMYCGAVQENIKPVLEKIHDMSLDILNLEIEVLEIEKSVVTQLGLARKYLTADIMSNLVPQYIQGQVELSVSDIFKTRSIEGMVCENVIQKLNSLRGSFYQLKAGFQGVTKELEDLKQDRNMFHGTEVKQGQTKAFEHQLINMTKQQEQLYEEVKTNQQSMINMADKNTHLELQLKDLQKQLTTVVQSHEASQQDVTYEVGLLKDTSFRDESVIRFDDVMYNRGKSYIKDSGIFTAPVSGTYLLWAHIMRNNNFWMAVHIRSNRGILLNGYSTAGPHPHDVATITGATYLDRGDRVWVSVTGLRGSVPLRGDYHSSYGGTLLKIN